MKQRVRICATCRFWALPDDAHGNTARADCRRHAPSYHGAHRSHWCQTHKDDWCGEWASVVGDAA